VSIVAPVKNIKNPDVKNAMKLNSLYVRRPKQFFRTKNKTRAEHCNLMTFRIQYFRKITTLAA
jgi:hypothetical protein